MAPHRKLTLQQRQEEMRARQLGRQDQSCKIDPERVSWLAMIGCSIEEIAAQIGCIEDALYPAHRRDIEVGRLRGGSLILQAVSRAAMEGDQMCLRYLMRKLNGEETATGPEEVKKRRLTKPKSSTLPESPMRKLRAN
jgi:hypothetical protein